MRYGTIIADPPWGYERTSRHEKLSGYSDSQYEPLSTDVLCELPVRQLAADNAVLLLWTTFPMLADALRVVTAWGFTYTTALAWVKAKPDPPMLMQSTEMGGPVGYGVGYWFRGAVEPCLVGRRGRSYRSPYVGVMGEGLRHSRKPDSLHELAEGKRAQGTDFTGYPTPRLELFARRARPGWTTLGNECEGDGRDIRESLAELIAEEAAS